MKRLMIAVVALATALPVVSSATTHTAAEAHAAHHATLAEGEVRRVDAEAKKLTIRHGPIVNLDMPAMTMVFQVRDSKLLEEVKAGDKIRFAADKVDGAYVLTQLERVQ
jgi:Cu/Ag efflux protein CusF